MMRSLASPLLSGVLVLGLACGDDGTTDTGSESTAESTVTPTGSESTMTGPATESTTEMTSTGTGTETAPTTSADTGNMMDCTPGEECGGLGGSGVPCGEGCCPSYEWCDESNTPPTCMCGNGPGCEVGSMTICCPPAGAVDPDTCGLECLPACEG